MKILNLFTKNVSKINNIFKKSPYHTGLSLKNVISNAYKPKEYLGDYKMDKSLSNDNQQIYFNPKDNKLMMSIAGTHNFNDVITDLRVGFGQVKQTNRFKEANQVWNKAKDKYDTNGLIVGHSLGSAIGKRVADRNDTIISYNPFSIGGKEKQNETIVRHRGDIASLLDFNKSLYDYGNPLDILNPIKMIQAHKSSSLNKNIII